METFRQRLIKGLEILIGLLLVGILSLVTALVVLRYVFNSSIAGANEMVTILFVYATALGAAVGVGRWDHVAIGAMVDLFGGRVRWIVDLIGILLVGLLNGVICVYSWRWIDATGNFVMPSTGLPRWVVQISVPLGCVLVVLFCLCRFWSRFRSGPECFVEPCPDTSDAGGAS